MTGRGNPRITTDILHMSNEEEEMEEEEENNDDFFIVPNLKRKLLADFGRPSVLEIPGSDQMRVYLRIRPLTDDELNKNENQSCLTVDSETTVSTHAPKDSHYFKNMSRTLTKTHVKYSFSKIFDESTAQKDFFNSTMLGLVKDFIEGQNCLVFSYGVTSSGKTYTIQGNPKDAGVLPRALDVLFNSINGKQYEGMNLKPTMFTNVQRLTPEQELFESRLKEKVLKLSCDDDLDVMSLLGDDASDMSVVNSTISSEASNISAMDSKDSFGSVEKLFDSLGDRVREDAKVSVEDQGQIRFSVWVCFSEIYNEQIFDLLEPMPKKKNSRRPCLKLSEDQNGSPYIKGLKYINVTSADEAYRLLTIGQRNLQKACTKLNHNSSRSHCIFNIKILRVVDKDDPQVARVSMLSLCDLAGSERYGKTQNTGERLKEAGNINTSLLTLGRCIQTLRFNQANKERTRIVPFRESKLTRLFQNFFVGRGKAAMFVNVNQCASMFDETQHVFKFSAVASQVVIQQKPVFVQPKLPVNAPIPRSSIMWDVPRNKVHEGASVPLPGEDEDEDLEEPDKQYTQENIDELLGLIESLENQLQTELRAKSKLEATIRAEVCQEMSNQFTRIEEQCSEQIRIREQMAEDMADKRIQIVLEAERAKRKKLEVKTDNEDEWVSSVLLHQEQMKVKNRDKTIEELNSEMMSVKDQLTEITSSQEQLLAQKQELESQVSKLEADTCPTDVKKAEVNQEDEVRANIVENLTQQLQHARLHSKEQDQEISELNDMLTEAGETFRQKESEIDKLKELTQEYKLKIEKQSKALKLLEQGTSNSQSSIETATKTMSPSEQRERDPEEVTGSKHSPDFIPESPLHVQCAGSDVELSPQIQLFKQSVCSLDLSGCDERKTGKSSEVKKVPSSEIIGRQLDYRRTDSSGVVADCDTDEDSETEIFFKPAVINQQETPNKNNRKSCPSVSDGEEFSLQYSGSDVSDCDLTPEKPRANKGNKTTTVNRKQFDFNEAVQKKNENYYKFHKPLNDSRVLQVILTPMKNKNVVKHTKSSMLRLKNSPQKDPTRGRMCRKNSSSQLVLKGKSKNTKRKCEDDDDEVEENLNTSKRRRIGSKNDDRGNNNKSNGQTKSRTGQKYNLRSRR